VGVWQTELRSPGLVASAITHCTVSHPSSCFKVHIRHTMKEYLTVAFVQVDGFTHLYTLILRPDLSYEVKVDGQSIESGSIEYDWNLTSLRKTEKTSLDSRDWDQVEGSKVQVGEHGLRCVLRVPFPKACLHCSFCPPRSHTRNLDTHFKVLQKQFVVFIF
jgi:hypothetical protein